MGSHLTEALIGAGHDVIGIDCFTDFYARESKRANLRRAESSARFELVEADLASADVDALVDGVDGVFHLAAQPGVRGSWGQTFELYVRDNVLATQRVLEAAASRRLRVVFASSSSVYGNAATFPLVETASCEPISPYGVTKLTCERLAGAYAASASLDSVALRYFTVYGPRQRPDMAFARIAASLVGGRPLEVYGDGRQSRDFTYVADAVDATLAAFFEGSSGAVYNVGGGSEASVNEVLALVGRLTGRDVPIVRRPAARGDVRRTYADTSRIRDELGWEPRTALAEGLRAQLDAASAGAREVRDRP